jgi:hypothetical protein
MPACSPGGYATLDELDYPEAALAADGWTLDEVGGPFLLGGAGTPDALSTVKHRPADVVPQPLVVKYELANRLWELGTLPPAFESPYALALAFRRSSTCGLDRIGGRTKLVRGDVCDGGGLASSVCGMPCCPTQVSRRGHCMAGGRASLGHPDLATHPGAGMLDRLTRSRVLRLSRLEEVEDVLRARCSPKSEELVIRIGEGPTTADRHETRVSDLREDHGWHSFCLHPPNARARTRDQALPGKAYNGPKPTGCGSREPLLWLMGVDVPATHRSPCPPRR